jgi:uncharacterized protein YaaR (DUF327 family)
MMEISKPHPMFCGLTAEEISELKYLMDVMRYSGRVKQFVNDAIEKGIPSVREQAIMYHQRKIEELLSR